MAGVLIAAKAGMAHAVERDVWVEDRRFLTGVRNDSVERSECRGEALCHFDRREKSAWPVCAAA